MTGLVTFAGSPDTGWTNPRQQVPPFMPNLATRLPEPERHRFAVIEKPP